MSARQIVKTNKRIVYFVDSDGNNTKTHTIGLTASAFYNLGSTEELKQSLVSGVTAGSACLSRVVAGGACVVDQRGEALFRTSLGGQYDFERFTVRSMTAGATAAVTVTNCSAIVEFVVGHPTATQLVIG